MDILVNYLTIIDFVDYLELYDLPLLIWKTNRLSCDILLDSHVASKSLAIITLQKYLLLNDVSAGIFDRAVCGHLIDF
jgi:hypothetical protein